jgi:hypothetical protein
MTTLLRHRIETLLLDPQCPFPSQLVDAKKRALDWREYQKPQLPADEGDDELIDNDRYEED